MAEELRKQAGVHVQVIDGARGEFTVLVNGREVAKNHDHDLPTLEAIEDAVEHAGEAPAAAKA